MTWFRLDDGWLAHPKHRLAGKDGRALWVAGGTHCAQQLTDGIIDKASVPLIAALAEVRPSFAKKLVEIGLWHDLGDVYEMHDFLDFNPSREKVMAERERWKRNKKKQRESPGVSTEDTREESTAESHRPRPVPSRPAEESSSSRGPAMAVDKVEDVLRALAKIKAVRAGGGKGPRWHEVTIDNDRREFADRIGRLLESHPEAPLDAVCAELLGERNTLANYRKSVPLAV